METDCNACIVVESVSPYLSDSELESSMLQHGVLITVFNKASTHISNNSELISYSLLAMATDYVDTLIEQWYSGTLNIYIIIYICTYLKKIFLMNLGTQFPKEMPKLLNVDTEQPRSQSRGVGRCL